MFLKIGDKIVNTDLITVAEYQAPAKKLRLFGLLYRKRLKKINVARNLTHHHNEHPYNILSHRVVFGSRQLCTGSLKDRLKSCAFKLLNRQTSRLQPFRKGKGHKQERLTNPFR